MEDKIKEIVATFTKTPVEQIGPSTPIGRSAVKSSILLHRMFAKLAEAGLRVDNYTDIRTYSDLPIGRPPGSSASGSSTSSSSGSGSSASTSSTAGLSTSASSASGPSTPGSPTPASPTSASPTSPSRAFIPTPADGSHYLAPASAGEGVGIDIEEVSAMPRTHDFRKEEFYKMNFTAGEIAYCILQADPYASFAGLFAAKEAIIKTDPTYRSREFSSIAIGHSAEGRPLHPGWSISISHAGTMAAAVAIPEKKETAAPLTPGPVAPQTKSGSNWTGWLALLLSAAAIIIHFIH